MIGLEFGMVRKFYDVSLLFYEIQFFSHAFDCELTMFDGLIDVPMRNCYEIGVFYSLVSCFKILSMIIMCVFLLFLIPINYTFDCFIVVN